MAARFVRSTAVLLTTAAVCVGAVGIAGDFEAGHALRQIAAAHPDLHVRAIHVEPFGGRLVLEGVEAGLDRQLHVTIDRLTIARPATAVRLTSSAHAEGAAATGTATAENVVIAKDMKVIRIKRIDLTGTSLSNADLASLLDAKSGEGAEARLRKLNATAIDMPEIVADDPTAGSEGHVVASQVKLSGVKEGKATAVSIGGITLQGKTGEKTTDGTVGAIQAFGVDLAQAAHVFGSVRQDDAEPIKPILDAVTVSGIKLSTDKAASLTIASLKETNVKARPLKSDVLASRDKDRPKMSKAEEAALFQDMSQSFEVGSLDVSQVVLHGDDADKPFDFTLSSFGMRGFGKGKFGGFSARETRFISSDIKLVLGRMEIGPFGLPQSDPGSAKAVMASAGQAEFDGIDIDVPSRGAGAAAGDRVKFKIAHGSFMSEGDPGEIPLKVKLSVANVTFDMPADPGQARPLADMGYRRLDLSAGLASTYEAGNQELQIHDLTLKGADMGSLAIGLHLLNVTKGVISPDPNVQKASALAMLVKGLTVDVADEGLVDRAIAWKAKQDGMSVDAERASIIEFFDKSLPAQFTSANVKVIGSAIAKFVAAPKTLHVGIVSKSGLGAASMGLLSDPNLLIDSLDVTAHAD